MSVCRLTCTLGLKYFDLEFIKKHSSEANIFDKFSSDVPELIIKLNLNNVSDEISHGYPYIVDFFKGTITNEEDSTTAYRELLQYYQQQFPSILRLITLYQILPLTNNECERAFSEYTRTKTRLRSVMETDLLGALLQLSLNYKDNPANLDFINAAVKRWRDAKERKFFVTTISEF